MPLYNASPVAEGRAKIGGTVQFSVPGVDFHAITSRALVASRLYYSPWFVVTPITIDQLAIEVTTAGAAGKIARMAIYNADTDWQPTSKVVDAGTVAVDPGAPPTVTTATISTILSPGRYLAALICDGTPTLRAFRGVGRGSFGLIPGLGATPIISIAYVGGSGTTLPDPGTAWTTTTNAATSMEHIIVARVSTP